MKTAVELSRLTDALDRAVATDATADPAITRAILELIPVGVMGHEYGILKRLLPTKATMTEAKICKAVCIARLDRLIEYCGFGDLQITQKGVERLDELIHHDTTRTARDAANAALAAMGLPA